MKRSAFIKMVISVMAASSSTMVTAQASDAELAQELTNPIADLITIPIQSTYDQNIGPNDEGYKLQTNIQPVIPVDISENWNLLTRTIVPVIQQDEIVPGSGSQFGLGDTSLSLFFSPKKPTNGVIWGVGPIALLPTATDAKLGGKKWGVGPAGIVVTMVGPWTIGGLANHLWSVAGDSERDDISNSFVQPFVAYTWPNAWTVSFQSEEWAVPFNAAVAKLVRFGKLPVSLQAGVGYWAESATNGPEGVRFRLQANIVLPKRLLF